MAERKCDHENCPWHSGIEARMQHVERDTQGQWKAIDRMRAWVIAGMGAVILNLALALMEVIKSTPGSP